jgi:hypothetical protein
VTTQRSTRTLRPKQIYGPNGVLAVGKTKFFGDIVLHDESDPYIPGTKKVRRLRLARLGPRLVMAFEDEVFEIVEALRAERDAVS